MNSKPNSRKFIELIITFFIIYIIIVVLAFFFIVPQPISLSKVAELKGYTHKINITNLNIEKKSDIYVISGEIINVYEKELFNINISVRLYDKNDNLIGYKYIPFDFLPEDYPKPFSVIFEKSKFEYFDYIHHVKFKALAVERGD
jgi:hypothetical protein